jgi:hypothetical protein
MQLTRVRRRGISASGVMYALIPLLALGCGGDDGIQPGSLRFGQVGEIRLTLVVPRIFDLDQGQGEIQQVLTWSSTGAWQLRERISFRGLEGDEELRSNPGDPGTYAAAYASLITQLNETQGLKLFPSELVDPTLDPTCPLGGTKVTLMIRDQIRDESVVWTRCAQESLGTLLTADAGPDPAAVRVIQAAILMRNYIFEGDFVSAYFGSIPFGTLDRGEDSHAELAAPEVIQSSPEGSLNTPPRWLEFWRDHKGDPTATPPPVDWRYERVLVAAVGKRGEAGDSVEIRRVIQTTDETRVEVFERVPGNFCSPASREHYPIHIVVAPLTRSPVEFLRVDTVRVPCGI